MDEKVDVSNARALLTFSAATMLGVVAGLFSAALRVFVNVPSEQVAFSAAIERTLETPLFVVGYDALVGAGLLIIYATRNRSEYYLPRLAFYAMFLTGAVSANVAPLLRVAAHRLSRRRCPTSRNTADMWGTVVGLWPRLRIP